jgi:hypothetical protein
VRRARCSPVLGQIYFLLCLEGWGGGWGGGIFNCFNDEEAMESELFKKLMIFHFTILKGAYILFYLFKWWSNFGLLNIWNIYDWWPLGPGSGMGESQHPDPGWTTRIIVFRAKKPFVSFLGVKILEFFDADPRSGIRNRYSSDPGWKKADLGSGTYKHPGSATLKETCSGFWDV